MLDFYFINSGYFWGLKLNFRFLAFLRGLEQTLMFCTTRSPLTTLLTSARRPTTGPLCARPPPRHNDVRRTSPRHAAIARPSSGGARRPMARWRALPTAHRSHRSIRKVRLSSREESRPTLMATNRDGDESRQRQRRWPPPPPRRPAPPSLTLFFSFMIR